MNVIALSAVHAFMAGSAHHCAIEIGHLAAKLEKLALILKIGFKRLGYVQYLLYEKSAFVRGTSFDFELESPRECNRELRRMYHRLQTHQLPFRIPCLLLTWFFNVTQKIRSGDGRRQGRESLWK
jgi:hypothetical protein